MGHMFGLPDMMGSAGGGVGSYDCMGNMWGRDGSQYYPGLMSAWSKTQLGWVEPTVLDTPGTYSIRAAVDRPQVYKITHGFFGKEYLLIENRRRREYDADLNDEGLLIWHIDMNNIGEWQQKPGWPGQAGWPGNFNHYQVAILQADGNYEMEQGQNLGNQNDMWKRGMTLGPGPASNTAVSGGNYPNTDSYAFGGIKRTGIRLSSFSDPGDTMSFELEIEGMQYPE